MNLEIWGVARQVIVFAYLAAAIIAAVCALRGERGNEGTNGGRRLFWWGVSFVLLLLALNKQFNLLSYLTRLGRSLAAEQGWYEARQAFQLETIFAVLIVGAVFLGFSILFMRRDHPRHWLVLAGVTFLLVLVLVRSVSLHALDWLLYRSVAGIPVNWFFELAAIAWVAGLTIMTLREGGLNKESV